MAKKNELLDIFKLINAAGGKFLEFRDKRNLREREIALARQQDQLARQQFELQQLKKQQAELDLKKIARDINMSILSQNIIGILSTSKGPAMDTEIARVQALLNKRGMGISAFNVQGLKSLPDPVKKAFLLELGQSSSDEVKDAIEILLKLGTTENNIKTITERLKTDREKRIDIEDAKRRQIESEIAKNTRLNEFNPRQSLNELQLVDTAINIVRNETGNAFGRVSPEDIFDVLVNRLNVPPERAKQLTNIQDKDKIQGGDKEFTTEVIQEAKRKAEILVAEQVRTMKQNGRTLTREEVKNLINITTDRLLNQNARQQ